MLGTWSEHADELLFDGERERRRVDLERATVVVTNQRVLAFTPDDGGPNYRGVDRPNVARVSVETESAPGRLVWASVLLALGLGLVAVAQTFDLADAVDGLAAGAGDAPVAADGALETVATVLSVFDLSIFAAGILLVLLAGVFAVNYARSRSRRLVLRVSGGDDISLPVTDADIEAGRPTDLEEAIGPGSAPAADGDRAPTGGEPTATDREPAADATRADEGATGSSSRGDRDSRPGAGGSGSD